jgi:DNA-binding NtrC family response regulator
MSATVVVVHEDSDIVQGYCEALKAAGHEVEGFLDPMAALTALESAHAIRLVITAGDFGPGKLNGVALARMARVKKPRMTILFVAPAEDKPFAEGLGEFLQAPASVSAVLEAANRLLATG